MGAGQARLVARSQRKRGAPNGERTTSPLAGKLFDEDGDRLLVTQAHGKSGRRYRYYVSRRLLKGDSPEPGAQSGWRLPASRIERALGAVLADHIEHLANNHRILSRDDLRASEALRLRARQLAAEWRAGDADSLAACIERATLAPDEASLSISRAQLAEALQCAPEHIRDEALICRALLTLRRRGVERRVILGDAAAGIDPVLVRTLAQAHAWLARLRAGETLTDIAANVGHAESHLRTRMKLAFLSPRIQRAILAGEQPADLTLERIVRAPVPLCWAEQARLYGSAQKGAWLCNTGGCSS